MLHDIVVADELASKWHQVICNNDGDEDRWPHSRGDPG